MMFSPLCFYLGAKCWLQAIYLHTCSWTEQERQWIAVQEQALLESMSQPPDGKYYIQYDVELYYLLKSSYLGRVAKRVYYKLNKEQDAF